MAAGLATLVPNVQVSIVPDHAAHRQPWGQGIGVGVLGNLIWALAPDGPAVSGGLRIGDRILSVDGQSWAGWRQLEGPVGSALRLTVERPDQTESLNIHLTRASLKNDLLTFPVYDVYIDRQAGLWFGLEDGEIIHHPLQNTWTSYTEAQGLEIGYSPRILQTRDGTIWTVSGHGLKGINRFNGKTWTSLSLRALGGDDHNRSILETRNGNLWVGGNKGYLHVLKNNKWTVYHPPQIPTPYTYMVTLLETSNGDLWTAGEGQEALRLDIGRWTTYNHLNFQCETPNDIQWFLSEDGAVLSAAENRWTRYDIRNGLMDAPVALFSTRNGDLWAAGSHDSTAATAHFNGTSWTLQTHPNFSWGIDRRASFESTDGTLWFGAANPIRERGHRGGLLRFNGEWTHLPPPEVLYAIYGIGQTTDGALWIGGGSLYRLGGPESPPVSIPDKLASSYSEVVYTAPNGDLWVGHRRYGVFHFNGKTWTQYDIHNGLSDNRIESILQAIDGSVWAATSREISRFDGISWTTCAMPSELGTGQLRQSKEGALWINQMDPGWYARAMPGYGANWKSVQAFRTIRYEPDLSPPETTITLSLDQVSQPGNTTLAWEGADPWRVTPNEELQYAWRLNGGSWSAYSNKTSHIFQALSSGHHTFEVKVRDRDFNEDSTPATVSFTVVPPVWQEPWFILCAIVATCAIAFQTYRIVVRDRQLRISNAALSDAMHELFQNNRDLKAANKQLEEAMHRLKTAQNQLVLQEKMASLGNLVAGVAHEINNPVGALNSAADVSARCINRIVESLASLPELSALPQDSRFNKALELLRENNRIALEASGRITRLVQSLRNFARLDESEFQEAELHEGLDSTLTLLNHELKDRVTVEKMYGTIPRVRCYPNQLNQVFMNLLVNAIHAIDGPGVIHIETTAADAFVHIKITDTGQGIPPEHLEKIFDPGFTTKGVGVGTGLGLSICYNIIQKHRGKIYVESQVGKGTTFTVSIPLSGEKA